MLFALLLLLYFVVCFIYIVMAAHEALHLHVLV